MAKADVVYKPSGRRAMAATLTLPDGQAVRVAGTVDDLEPEIDGDELLSSNRAVVANLWAYAHQENLRRRSRADEKRSSYERAAKSHAKTASGVAELAVRVTDRAKAAWCSACFTESEHRRVQVSPGRLPACLCSNCGAPTLTCASPSCDHMAVRGRGAVRVPRYCAEHRHDIPGFDKGTTKVDDLGNYENLIAFEKRNLARGTKVLGVGALLAGATGGAAVYFAPVIGGALGTLVSTYAGGSALYGAAASSYGLALLGGGSVAAGGLGMFGGTVVVGAVGTGLGGLLGASLTSTYISQDKSFRIDHLWGEGAGVPVLIVRGFLSEGSDEWRSWKPMITRRYPDSPVYGVA